MKMTIEDAALRMGATLIPGKGASPRNLVDHVTGASIDSRDLQPGDLFFAISGRFLNGHDFVNDALRKGAAGVVVASRVLTDGDQIVADDPSKALVRLASWVRDLVDPIVVGVTGSVGKTSTKDLLHAVASRRFLTVAAERSFNNDLGVPLTLLKIRNETEVLVSELGSRGAGHIAALCAYVRPQVGVVTNVGVTHYEQFGSREAIVAAKAELIEALPQGGTAILNADDPFVVAMAKSTPAQVLTYGIEQAASLRADSISFDRMGRPSFRMTRGRTSVWVELLMSGVHQVSNALAAATAGLALGVALEDSAEGLRRAVGSPWRMQIESVNGITFVNDAFSANPTSMTSALRTCSAMAGASGRLIAVLGQMAELGDISEQEHRQAGAITASVGHRLIVVGEKAMGIARGAFEQGMGEVIVVDDVGAVPFALGDLRAGDVVLVKGSRVAGMELVVADIKQKVVSA